jgi:hypothetical protein
MSLVRRYVLLALAALALLGAPACEHEPDPIGAVPDAGLPGSDAAANLPDAGGVPPCHDAGMPADAGPNDGGTPDGGMPDAGMPDAGLIDADIPDAGPTDASIPDAGGGIPPCPDAG